MFVWWFSGRRKPVVPASIYMTCSFCGVPSNLVKHLIAGMDSSAICDGCIVSCALICQKLDSPPPLGSVGRISRQEAEPEDTDKLSLSSLSDSARHP